MQTLLTVAAILGLTALFSYINERFLHLQQTIGLVLLALFSTQALMVLNGLGLGTWFADEQDLVTRLSLDATLLNGVLCFMLFAGSINVDIRSLREERWVILTLAIGATLIAAVLIGLAVYWALGAAGVGIGLMMALVFGALISPTDPIAALAILAKVGLPPRLEAIINGESLFNDGVGVVIFTIFLAAALGRQQPSLADAVVMFLREVFGGVALGLAAAAAIHHLMTRTSDYGTHVLISLAVVSLSYGLAETLEVSGPIAIVVTGLVVGNFSLPRLTAQQRAPFGTFWQAIEEVLNAMLFVVIGLHVAIMPSEGLPPSATIAVLVCLLARWISVNLSLNALSVAGALKADRLGLTNLLTWGGLRGGLAVAMAMSLPDGPDKPVILHMTYGVVMFSIIVQGLSIARLFSAERLSRLLR
jgi:CPA1 family monovalent cation:H+ antiporter